MPNVHPVLAINSVVEILAFFANVRRANFWPKFACYDLIFGVYFPDPFGALFSARFGIPRRLFSVVEIHRNVQKNSEIAFFAKLR